MRRGENPERARSRSFRLGAGPRRRSRGMRQPNFVPGRASPLAPFQSARPTHARAKPARSPRAPLGRSTPAPTARSRARAMAEHCESHQASARDYRLGISSRKATTARRELRASSEGTLAQGERRKPFESLLTRAPRKGSHERGLIAPRARRTRTRARKRSVELAGSRSVDRCGAHPGVLQSISVARHICPRSFQLMLVRAPKSILNAATSRACAC